MASVKVEGTILQSCFISPNELDSNGEAANVVDVIGRLAHETHRVATAILANAAPGHDAAGGRVESLTEAVMGITAGLVAIAAAINHLAEAVRDSH